MYQQLVALKACGHLKNFRVAVNGPENACKQFGKPASGTFPGAELFRSPLSVLAILNGQHGALGVRMEELKGLQILPQRDWLVKSIFLMK